jgi:type 1 fimbria pilin
MLNKRQTCFLLLLQGGLFSLPSTGHAATVLTGCFTAPQDYQISYSRELATTENSVGYVIEDSTHHVGSGAELEANCTCPKDMEASEKIYELSLAGSPLSAGASGFGYLTDTLDVRVSGYNDAINSPDGSNLTELAITQYPTARSSMQKMVDRNKSTEGSASVCSESTRPEANAPVKRQFKWNVIGATFLVKKTILGEATIPPTLVVQNYACLYYGTGSCDPASAEHVSNIWLSGSLSAPLSCTINEGSTIEVDFGDLVSSQFVSAGQQPKGFTLKDVDISYQCGDNTIGKNDRIKLTLSADQGVVDTRNPVVAKMVDREDLGVRVFGEENQDIALDGSYDFPIKVDEQGKGVIHIKATPVSTQKSPPAAGSFEGNVTVKMDLR